jgi:hypothetical protein
MYEYLIGFLPVQLPGSAVNDWPTCGDPEIVGGETFTGAPDGGAAEAVVVVIATTRAASAARTKRRS